MKKLFERKKREGGTYNATDYKYFVNPRFVGHSSIAEISVIRVEYRPFYDSKWAVITPHFSVFITRTDSETAEHLLDEIVALPSYTKETIERLDERDKIYYD